MKKLFSNNKKKDRPSSASDSTLRVPPSPVRLLASSNERISSTSHSAYSTTTTRVVHTVQNITTSGTFPRNSYKPVYERTQEWSNKFDRASPSRHSTASNFQNPNFQPSQRKLSVPINVPYTPSGSSYSRPPPSPLATFTPSTDARTFQVPYSLGAIHRRPVQSQDLENVLQINVRKCQTTRNQPEKIPTYQTNSRGKRGSLLVINNIKFGKHEKERNGAEKDMRNIEELFRQMNFERTTKTNLKKSEMESVLKTYAKKNFNQYDISVIVMMSHGCGDADSGSTQISGTDGRNLATTDITNYFSITNCPSLAGKPKIFIFQCCRGSQEQVHTDATRSSTDSREGDMLLAYATIPGFVSYRQACIGSWYIQAICKVFMDHAHDTHVEDMLKMVDGALAVQAKNCGRGQTSSYENRGFKCCYFNPT